MKYIYLIVTVMLIISGINYCIHSKSTNAVSSNNIQAEADITLPPRYDRDAMAFIVFNSLITSPKSVEPNTLDTYISKSYNYVDNFLKEVDRQNKILQPVQIAPKPIVNAGFPVK